MFSPPLKNSPGPEKEFKFVSSQNKFYQNEKESSFLGGRDIILIVKKTSDKHNSSCGKVTQGR